MPGADTGVYFGRREGEGMEQPTKLFIGSQLRIKCFFLQLIADNRVTSFKISSLPHWYSLKGKNWLGGKSNSPAPT